MSLLSNGTNGHGSNHSGGSTNGLGSPKVVSLTAAKVIEPADAKMDQIRDLLFGEFKREIDQRMSAFDARLVDLERRLAAARAEDESKRKAMLDDIARGVSSLSEHVKQITR